MASLLVKDDRATIHVYDTHGFFPIQMLVDSLKRHPLVDDRRCL